MNSSFAYLSEPANGAWSSEAQTPQGRTISGTTVSSANISGCRVNRFHTTYTFFWEGSQSRIRSGFRVRIL